MKAGIAYLQSLCIALLLLVSMSSCEVIGDIFEAGAWTGAILVIGVIGLVIWFISKLFGGGKRT